MHAQGIGQFAVLLLPEPGVDHITIHDDAGGLVEIDRTQNHTLRRRLSQASRQLKAVDKAHKLS
jgi:hypothetical protein